MTLKTTHADIVVCPDRFCYASQWQAPIETRLFGCMGARFRSTRAILDDSRNRRTDTWDLWCIAIEGLRNDQPQANVRRLFGIKNNLPLGHRQPLRRIY